MTHPEDKRGSGPPTGVHPTSFSVCLGLGIVLGGMEEAKANSEMFHRVGMTSCWNGAEITPGI